jgi:hypothetical protein
VHPRHPKKEVNDALDYADDCDFEVEQTAAGHKWGRIVCRNCPAWEPVWSTPKSPHNHGRRLRQWVKQHQHEHGAEEGR